MSHSDRLQKALAGPLLEAAKRGVILLHPAEGYDVLEVQEILEDTGARITIEHSFAPDIDHYQKQGFAVTSSLAAPTDKRRGLCVVCLPRSKRLGHELIYRAVQSADFVFVDGQKTDGIESAFKACKAACEVLGSVTKAHGRGFWFASADIKTDLADWAPRAPSKNKDGFWTQAGAFSDGHMDLGSQLLISHLPSSLGARVADLGAGWGALSAHLLDSPKLQKIDLVEGEQRALACAKLNVPDPRAEFICCDVRSFIAQAPYDAVVMNPPFHIGRQVSHELGLAFIETAARILRPKGQLWMVANINLPYEQILSHRFKSVQQRATARGFKVIQALA